VLADTELRAIWNACQNDDFGRILRLLILTACRREEIGGIQWSEIDFDRAMLNIPGARTKNRNPLNLPLSPMALTILEALRWTKGRGGNHAKRECRGLVSAAAPLAHDATPHR
jgi:integrase